MNWRLNPVLGNQPDANIGETSILGIDNQRLIREFMTAWPLEQARRGRQAVIDEPHRQVAPFRRGQMVGRDQARGHRNGSDPRSHGSVLLWHIVSDALPIVTSKSPMKMRENTGRRPL